MGISSTVGKMCGKAVAWLPCRSSRRRAARSAAVASAVAGFCERHGAFGVAIAANAILVALIGGRVVYSYQKTEADMTATIGFVSPQLPAPPAASSPAASVSFQVASVPSPSSSVPSMLVTTGPSPLQFSVPSNQVSISGVPPSAGAAPGAVSTGGEQTGGGTSGKGRSPGGEGVVAASSSIADGRRRLGGMNIRSERLGAIMEISAVTVRILPTLSTQIDKLFPQAFRANVYGCRLADPHNRGFDEILTAARKRGPHVGAVGVVETDASTIDAIVSLVENDHVDAIFWFTDAVESGFDNPELISRLKTYLIDKKVRFYIKIFYSEAPTEMQKNLIEETGGDWYSPLKEVQAP